MDVRMNRRAGLGTALTCAVAIGALTPAVAQDMPFESKIKIGNGPPAFHGTVNSGSEECISNRKVRLFMVRKGADKLIGKDRTAVNGNWEILTTPKGGAYYAKVNEFARETPQLVCLSDRTERVLVD